MWAVDAAEKVHVWWPRVGLGWDLHPASGAEELRALRAWGTAERARADKAEAIGAAERALRVAVGAEWGVTERVQALADDEAMGRDVYPEAAGLALVAAEEETARCEAALRALGVDP